MTRREFIPVQAARRTAEALARQIQTRATSARATLLHRQQAARAMAIIAVAEVEADRAPTSELREHEREAEEITARTLKAKTGHLAAGRHCEAAAVVREGQAGADAVLTRYCQLCADRAFVVWQRAAADLEEILDT